MKPPDKGSFVLDHFQECSSVADRYTQCLERHQMLPKRCRNLQIQYMKCRMDKGLMKEEDFQKLGFTEKTSWESEEQEKKFLFDKMEEQKKKAKAKAQEFLASKQPNPNPQPAKSTSQPQPTQH